MSRRAAVITLAHLLSIGAIAAERIIARAERQSSGRHAWAAE